MRMKVSNYIAKRLVEEGIKDVFMITGGGAMHLNDGLGHEPGLKCWYNHHEQASAIAAESYARIHNKIAALCVTTGPGGTNALTGVVGGWLDSIPMLVISGQVRYDTTARSTGLGIRAMGDQEFDITKAVDSMTKYCEMVIDPMRIRFCLEKALYLAQAGRPGPCWLDIPVNVQGAYIETDDLWGFDKDDYEAGGTGWTNKGQGCGACMACAAIKMEGKARMIMEDIPGQGEKRIALPKPVSLDTAREILKKVREAKRPVINAGNGIRIGKAHDVFMRVVEKLGIPVVTGWNSQDCMYDAHPLYVGRAGNMGDRPGNFAVQNSDLVLSLGSRLSIRQVGFNYQTWAREAYVIYNDIDAEELKKPSVHTDMPVHADVKDLLEKLELVLEEESVSEEYGPKDKEAVDWWINRCQEWKVKYPVVQPKHYAAGPDEPANIYAAMNEIGLRAKEGQITVVGNGSPCVAGGQCYQMKPGQRFISNSAIASMGYDLPAAIGACVADGNDSIVCIAGDGSIMMNLQELQTIVTNCLPI